MFFFLFYSNVKQTVVTLVRRRFLDLGMQCLSMSNIRDARLILVRIVPGSLVMLLFPLTHLMTRLEIDIEDLTRVLIELLNELWKRDKMRGLPSILAIFHNEINKFNEKSQYAMLIRYPRTLRVSVKTLSIDS